MVKKKIKVSDILGDNYYVYELTSSNYTPALNGSITITCIMKDVYGTVASGKSITLYQNGTSKGAQTTNSSGVATWSITCSTAGLQIFSIKDTSIEVFVDNKEDTSNKVTSLSSSSTDTQYPSAKAVYDAIFSLDTLDCINENFTILSLPQIIITYNENSFDGSPAYILSSYGERAYVDWGDSTPIETYDKNDILEHEYSDNIQEHTIIIYGNIDGGSLYDASFRGLSGATSINIPSAVHSMEGNIFLDCTGLTSVNLPQELTNIWSNTFNNCINLNTIILNWTELPPIGYSRLMDGAFGMNSTFSISIPYGTTSLYENAGYPTEKLVERSE